MFFWFFYFFFPVPPSRSFRDLCANLAFLAAGAGEWNLGIGARKREFGGKKKKREIFAGLGHKGDLAWRGGGEREEMGEKKILDVDGKYTR